MKRYIVRTNCEYSLEIEAKDVRDAIQKARESFCDDPDEWNESWSPFDAEEESLCDDPDDPDEWNDSCLPFDTGEDES